MADGGGKATVGTGRVEAIVAGLPAQAAISGAFKVAPFGSAGSLRVDWQGRDAVVEMTGRAKVALQRAGLDACEMGFGWLLVSAPGPASWFELPPASVEDDDCDLFVVVPGGDAEELDVEELCACGETSPLACTCDDVLPDAAAFSGSAFEARACGVGL